MIPADRLGNALYALNAVLVLARHMAQTKRDSADIARVLDVAEYLPRLMSEPEDATTEFREQLVGLATDYPEFALAVERFDKPLPTSW
jgi:hypothetical protein